MKKKIMTVFGTRPEAIKICPLVNEMKKRDAHVWAASSMRAMPENEIPPAMPVDYCYDIDTPA